LIPAPTNKTFESHQIGITYSTDVIRKDHKHVYFFEAFFAGRKLRMIKIHL
jgi:hypothetical protein